jgi:hypothetical protein
MQTHTVRRVKYMVGYPEDTAEHITEEGDTNALTDFEHYGLGSVRTREDYLELTSIDPVGKTCGRMKWCNKGELE